MNLGSTEPRRYHFWALDNLSLLQLSGAPPNVHIKFPIALYRAAFKHGVIRLELGNSA